MIRKEIYMFEVTYRAETADGVFCDTITVMANCESSASAKAKRKLRTIYKDQQVIDLCITEVGRV